MLHMSLPWWEFVARALTVFVFLLVFLRLTGKRQIGQLAPFDLVLLLLLSNAVQNSMNGGDNSLVGGLISAASLLFMNLFLGYLVTRSKKAEVLIEGHPHILVQNGKCFQKVLDEQNMSPEDLDRAIRESGLSAVHQVKLAILETNGAISVIAK